MGDSFADNSSGQLDAFAAVIAAHRDKKEWYEVDWKKFLTARNCYLFSASISFFFLALFGAVTIIVTSDTAVANPAGRCCSNMEPPILNVTRMLDQVMPYQHNLNSVWYGTIMIVNSIFGALYVWGGIKSENKYQLAACIMTQVLEVLRALFDTWFETNPDLQSRRVPREVLAYSSLFTLIVSTALAGKIWRQFGWAVFRRGGTLKPIRELYKTYQVFRGFNRMDVQSSTLLFLIIGMYMRIATDFDWWVFWSIVICDAVASRYMVKFIKNEDRLGFYVTVVAKSYVVLWWIAVTVEYVHCKENYMSSLRATAPYFQMDPYPDLESIRATYNGVRCLSRNTRHDDRTVELIALNLSQALLFRIISMVYGIKVELKSGTGLKGVFYKTLQVKEGHARKMQSEAAAAPKGGTVVAFKGKRRVQPKGPSDSATELRDSITDASNNNNNEDGESPAQYEKYEYNADSDASGNIGDGAGEEEEAGDAWEREVGISRRELQEDLAW